MSGASKKVVFHFAFLHDVWNVSGGSMDLLIPSRVR